MEKVDLTKQFAYRLRDSLIAAGHNSHRSITGVNMDRLIEITGHSRQICHRYLNGKALPEPAKLAEIAEKLNVSPGWLLFGDCHNDSPQSSSNITISSNLLRYIFEQANTLYTVHRTKNEVSDFLMDLAFDVSQIDASEEQSKKIIDLALASATHFSR